MTDPWQRSWARHSCLVWGILAFAFWLNANPYIGIGHDARLYVLMAYRWVSPTSFDRDPWFAFGSQDDYSLFSPLLAEVLRLFGVADGALIATLCQGLLLSIACLALARAGIGRSGYPLVAMVMLSFPILYSPLALLSVSEGFVTARGFAIPLALFGLQASVRRRPVAAFLCLGTGMALHPIMAAAPLAVSVLLPMSKRWRIWLLLAGWVTYVLLLLFAMSGHLPMLEGEWRTFVELSPLVFINSWIPNVIATFSLGAVMLALAARLGAPSLRPVYGLVLPVTVSGVAFSALAALAPWVTAIQAQLWRGLWLFNLLAICATADLLWRFVFAPEAEAKKTMGLAALLILVLALSQPWVALVVLPVAFCLPRRGRAEAWLGQYPWLHRAGFLLLLALALPGIAFELTGRVVDQSIQGFWHELPIGLWRNAGFGLFAFGFWWLGHRMSRRGFLLVALCILMVTAWFWDGRSSERKEQEARYSLDGRYSAFVDWIPRGATVSWHDETERVWFELATSGYAGAIHSTGLVFSEGRTLLLADRYSRLVLGSLTTPPAVTTPSYALRPLASEVGRHLSFFSPGNLRSYEDAAEVSKGGIAWLCADPDLDYVIDRQSRPDALAKVREADGKLWYVYRCATLAHGRER